jgi:hypothetical protein
VWRAQVASLTLPVRAAGRSSAIQAVKSVLCAQAVGMVKMRAMQATDRRQGIDIGFMRSRLGKELALGRRAVMIHGV